MEEGNLLFCTHYIPLSRTEGLWTKGLVDKLVSTIAAVTLSMSISSYFLEHRGTYITSIIQPTSSNADSTIQSKITINHKPELGTELQIDFR